MTSDRREASVASELSEEEKKKISAEVRYAQLVTQAGSNAGKPKPTVDKILGFLSNGFILLLLGSIITSGLVPIFQRQHEARNQQLALMNECFSQFLLYSNSIWQEYYTILPLTQEIGIDKKTYLEYINKIAEIKLKRYDSFAKVEALSIVFRNSKDGELSDVDNELKQYAVSLNIASAAIDKWLTALYCTPTDQEVSPCESFNPKFDPFINYLKIQDLVLEIGNENSDEVSSIIVRKIQDLYK